jgi:hypothetical protein
MHSLTCTLTFFAPFLRPFLQAEKAHESSLLNAQSAVKELEVKVAAAVEREEAASAVAVQQHEMKKMVAEARRKEKELGSKEAVRVRREKTNKQTNALIVAIRKYTQVTSNENSCLFGCCCCFFEFLLVSWVNKEKN